MGALVYNHDTISAGVETRAHSNWYLWNISRPRLSGSSQTHDLLHDCSDESAQKRTTYMWSIEFRVTVESST